MKKSMKKRMARMERTFNKTQINKRNYKPSLYFPKAILHPHGNVRIRMGRKAEGIVDPIETRRLNNLKRSAWEFVNRV